MLVFLRRRRTLMSMLSLALFLIFGGWLWLTVIPIATVEAKYQFQRLLTDGLGVADIRALIIPDFEAFNFEGGADYPEFGLVIPRIYLNEPVIANVNPHDQAAYTLALQQGIAHASGTAFPDHPGLGYYFAHSTSPEFANQFKAVFYLLGKLETGDTVYLWQAGQQFKYLVSRIEVTDPSDVSFLNREYQHETIVLQTCWPPGTTHQRLLVYAERAE